MRSVFRSKPAQSVWHNSSTSNSVDEEWPHESPKIRNIALEKACRTLKIITIAAIRYAVYEYHLLLAACCYNISV